MSKAKILATPLLFPYAAGAVLAKYPANHLAKKCVAKDKLHLLHLKHRAWTYKPPLYKIAEAPCLLFHITKPTILPTDQNTETFHKPFKIRSCGLLLCTRISSSF